MISADVQANAAMIEEATARVRRVATMSAKWNRLALCGLIERLAAGIAYHTINDNLTYAKLSGGADTNLVCVGITGQPAAAIEGGVFLSVAVDDDINANTFAAVLAATNGEGATLYTDHVAVDPSNNHVIAPTADGEPLAAGCWKALYRIAQLYEASHAGALFAYAFVRGLHKILSVVSHTDEGGIMRDILRTKRFEVPHGVITLHLNQYNGLPQPYGKQNMEAEYGSVSLSNKNKMITTAWDGDWESFKQKFEATADLNGLNEAVTAGQLLAEDKICWPWLPTKVDKSDEISAEEKLQRSSEFTSKEKFLGRTTAQSHRLASLLTLSLLDSTGIQKSIVADRLRYEKDGVRAWAELIQHFEMSSKDLRIENLTQQWDNAVLKVGEHPDQLWTKLTSINQNLKKLGEEFKESHFVRRFIAGVKAQPGNPYKQVLTMYKGSVIAGSPLSMNQMRELLSETYVDEKVATGQEYENMKGFIAFKACVVCKKKGHTEENCWVAHPEKGPDRFSANKSHKRNGKGPKPTCWKCGKPGHVKRECRH